MKKVVLAYSGGLDTSVAVAWLREKYDVEVVTLTVDVGGGSLREGVAERAISAGASRAYVVDGRERFVARLLLAGPPGEREVPGRLSPGHRAGASAHRPAARRGRAPRACRCRRPWLHRQGQRPGPLRRRRARAGPEAGGRRADARRHGPERATRRSTTPPSAASRSRSPRRRRTPSTSNIWGRSIETGRPRGSLDRRRRPTSTSGPSTRAPHPPSRPR